MNTPSESFFLIGMIQFTVLQQAGVKGACTFNWTRSQVHDPLVVILMGFYVRSNSTIFICKISHRTSIRSLTSFIFGGIKKCRFEYERRRLS